MARHRPPPRSSPADETQPSDGGSSEIEELIRKAERTGTTGQLVMAIQPGAHETALNTLRSTAGLAVASTADAGGAELVHEDLGERGIFFHRLGLVVAPAQPDQARAVAGAGPDSGIRYSRPERYWRVTAIGTLPTPTPLVPGVPIADGLQPLPQPVVPPMAAGIPLEYLLGYRDAIVRLVEALTGVGYLPTAPGQFLVGTAAAAAAPAFQDTDEATWGLQAIGVVTSSSQSSLQGRGVKVAILDTGLDLAHQDFLDGRVAATKTFIPSQAVQDNFGHGTHCAGIACGPLSPSTGRRYGVAPGAQLYIGKVATNDGGSIDRLIANGIQWALDQECRIASMSLQLPGTNGKRDPIIDQIGQAALDNNLALIAAAGNDSRRNQTPPRILPVGVPASSPQIMAVAAVDRFLNLAYFSNTSGPDQAGSIDIAGPGVDCYSSYSHTATPHQGMPAAAPYVALSGTSMATPHVAGVAALIAEQHPEYNAASILNGLMMIARPLNIPSKDAGKGLVRAPRED
jgi:subtilisin family serine protease